MVSLMSLPSHLPRSSPLSPPHLIPASAASIDVQRQPRALKPATSQTPLVRSLSLEARVRPVQGKKGASRFSTPPFLPARPIFCLTHTPRRFPPAALVGMMASAMPDNRSAGAAPAAGDGEGAVPADLSTAVVGAGASSSSSAGAAAAAAAAPLPSPASSTSSGGRRKAGYSGLANQGATCYMNSLLQVSRERERGTHDRGERVSPPLSHPSPSLLVPPLVPRSRSS